MNVFLRTNEQLHVHYIFIITTTIIVIFTIIMVIPRGASSGGLSKQAKRTRRGRCQERRCPTLSPNGPTESPAGYKSSGSNSKELLVAETAHISCIALAQQHRGFIFHTHITTHHRCNIATSVVSAYAILGLESFS